MQWVIAATVFVATAMQFLLAVLDLGDTKRAALDWSVAEDELAAEHRPWKRRSVRRELRAMRTPEIHRGIIRLNASMVSWLLLVAASGTAMARANPPW